MEKAIDYLRENVRKDCVWEDMDILDNIPMSDIAEIMNRFAEKVLIEAASIYKNVHMKDSFGCTCDVPGAIMSVKNKLS